MRRVLSALTCALLAACGPDGDQRPHAGDGDGDGGPGGSERCDNGWDDDRDGVIDEDCGCAMGATQACWPGAAEERGVGECRDGVQTCVGSDEFTEWGPCMDAATPRPDELGDGIDQDCSGGDGGSSCAMAEATCNDAADNDCDGMIDCDDPDCATTPGCTCSEHCLPGASRFCDTAADCTWGTQTCNPDGTWGTCTETPTPEACRDFGEDVFGVPTFYDTDCCLELPNACCQNYPQMDSVGECAGVTTCG